MIIQKSTSDMCSLYLWHEPVHLMALKWKHSIVKLVNISSEFPHPGILKRGLNFAEGFFFFIVLGFNDTSALVGHFVSFPRKREKRDRRDSSGDKRGGQTRKRNRNESEETEEIKNILPLPLPATRIAGLAQLEANICWMPQWCRRTDTFCNEW